MTKKKRELIEILLDNVKPEDWPENLPYVAQDKDCTVNFYSIKPIVYPSDYEFRMDSAKGKHKKFKIIDICRYWNKTIVHRDEFMKRWNERNTKAEVKTQQQLALEKFGTDWHDNDGVQPFSDTSIKIDLEFKNGTTRENVNVESSSFKIPFDTTSFTVTKWRIHSDDKESQISKVEDVMKSGGYTDRGSIELACKPESGIEKVIEDRGINYGRFEDGAEIMQQLKLIAHTSQGWERMKPIQREGMDMILHKIGRILNGDPAYTDSWIDIEGYSKLVSDWLKGESK